MNHSTPTDYHVRRKLVLVEMLILAIPISVLSYIFFQGNYRWESHHLILMSMLIMLILIGLIIVRQIFDKISIISSHLKRVESGDTVSMDIQHDIEEFHEISTTFNNLVKKLETTSQDLRKSHLELVAIKDIAETAKGERDIERLFDLLLEKAMSVTDSKTGSVLMVEEVAPSNTDLVVKDRYRALRSNDGSFHKIRIISAKGHNEALEKDSMIDIGNYVAKSVLIDGQPLLIQDIENDSRTHKTNDPKYGPPSFLSMPIFAGKRLVGVINLSNKSRGQLFDDGDMKVISIILDAIGFAIENATMHSILENRLKIIKGHNLELEKQIEAHRRTERELYDSKNKYEELFNFLPISVFEIDPNGNFTMVNHTSIETFGYTQDEVSHGMTALRMFIPEDIERAKSDMQKVWNGEEIDGTPYTMIRKDGSKLPVLIYAKPISCMNTIVGLRGVVIDFTKRKQLEEALQESEKKYRFLADRMTDIVWIQNMDLQTVYVSPSIKAALGFSPEERMAQDVQKQLTPESLSWAAEVISRELDQEKKGHADPERKLVIELEYYHKDGSTRWMENIISGIRDDDGVLTGLHGVSRDVTKRKRAEQALEREHMLLRNLIDNVPDRIYAKDSGGRFIICNEAMIRHMGVISMDQIEGKTDFDLLPLEMAQRFYDDEQEIITTGIPMINREEPLTMEDGQIKRWSLATKVPMLDRQGNKIGIVGVGREITDLKRTREELQKTREQLFQSEKLAALGRLSAGIAHEILNPLNIISMELQMLQTMKHLPPEIMEEVKICMDQTERIVKITKNLTKLSRLPVRKTVVTDINGVISEILNLYTKQLKIEGIETEMQYEAALPSIAVDKEMIEQVFMNLIANATDAMEGKGKKVLRIRTELEKTPGQSDQLKITIADTGTGIMSEHMSKIFDPFFTTKEPGRGTGLGLSLSYGIIHDHGGVIRAANNEWGGASFYINLPVKVEAKENQS